MNIFQRIFYRLNNYYDLVVIKINSLLIVSIFLVYYIIFPFININRSLFGIRFNIYIILFLFLTLIFFYLIFNLFDSIFTFVTNIVFADYILKKKSILCFGAFLLSNYPAIFGVYICLSISSFHLHRYDPDIIWYHILYCLCVFFRNFFIVPALGYTFIIKINKKKKQLLQETLPDLDFNFQELHEKYHFTIPLFFETPLIDNLHFCNNFMLWNETVEELTPSPESLKITSVVSLITTSLWYLFYGLYFLSFYFIYQDYISDIEYNLTRLKKIIDPFLSKELNLKNDHLIYQKIALAMNSKLENIVAECAPFKEKNSKFLDILYITKRSFFEKMKEKSNELIADGHIFEFSRNNKYDNDTTQDMLIYLCKKYNPEALEGLINNFIKSQNILQDNYNSSLFSEKNNSINSCLELDNFIILWFKKLIKYIF